MNTNYNIENGPSTAMLFDAVRYAYSKDCKINVSFSVAYGYTAPLSDPGCSYIPLETRDWRIVSIEHEDGSGCSFNLRGHCKVKEGGEIVSVGFKAYYNAKTRKGKISFS